MRKRISASRAARSCSDLLDRVRDKGDSFVIVHDGEEVGILGPVSSPRPKTLNELLDYLAEIGPPDEDFARDLEENRRNQPALPEDPWPSRPPRSLDHVRDDKQREGCAGDPEVTTSGEEGRAGGSLPEDV